MKQILKLVCFILVPVSFLSCDSTKDKAVKNAIADKEHQKGNEVLFFSTDYEKDGSGIITVYYNAEVQASGESDASKASNFSDSVQVWQTGDGHYQSR